MKKGNKDEKAGTEAERAVRTQLTLRAVLWDVSADTAGQTQKLDDGLARFQIVKITNEKESGNVSGKEKYAKLVQMLDKAGIREADTVLVTDDAQLACAASEAAAAIVFYEAPGSSTDVSAQMIVQGFEEIGVQFLDRVQKRKNRIPWNILYTERTCVREIQLSDLDELYRIYSQPGITDYVEPLFERQEEEAYVKSYIECMYYYYGYGMWVICDRKTGRLIGRAGIEHRESGDQVLMELGYIVRREYQRKGYACEVCRAVLEYAAQVLEMEEIHCFVDRDNRASVRTAQKLGFVCAGTASRNPQMLHFHQDLK